jgi:putative PEP-CTERM system histidine kinase
MHASPVRLPANFLASITLPGMSAALGVAIPWRGALLGFIVLGPQKTGINYTAEDHEFLRTVAAQVAAPIAAIRLAEAVEQAPRVEPSESVTPAVIHDIKNSVSALSLLANNASKHMAEPDFQRDAIVTLSRTVERMRRLLGKLSSTTPAETAATAEPIDLHELIIEATTSLAGDGKVRLVRRLHPVTRMYGDRDTLLRVVENLTTNAAEAIEREGTVTVTLGEEHGYAVISVADTGCGISEEYKEHHLFSPFRSTKRGGWGVGLYQTKQAVESQDGEILVESLEGRGTTFTVKLPLRTDVESGRLESVR